MPSVKEDLVTLEKQFWQAMVDKDTDAALKLTNDPALSPERRGCRASARKNSAR